jgi:hypothetical protein
MKTKTIADVKPVCSDLTEVDRMIFVPLCETMAQFSRFMTAYGKGKMCAKAWADLQTWCWRNPQNTIFN